MGLRHNKGKDADAYFPEMWRKCADQSKVVFVRFGTSLCSWSGFHPRSTKKGHDRGKSERVAGHEVGDQFFVACVDDYDRVVTSSQRSRRISNAIADLYCVPRHKDDEPKLLRLAYHLQSLGIGILQPSASECLGRPWASPGFIRSPSAGVDAVNVAMTYPGKAIRAFAGAWESLRSSGSSPMCISISVVGTYARVCGRKLKRKRRYWPKLFDSPGELVCIIQISQSKWRRALRCRGPVSQNRLTTLRALLPPDSMTVTREIIWWKILIHRSRQTCHWNHRKGRPARFNANGS